MRRTNYITHFLAFGVLLGLVPLTQAQVGSAFTYQGHLMLNGEPVTDTGDFHFKLYDAYSGGTQIGDYYAVGVYIDNGLFTAPIDFGSGVFDGTPAWLEVEVSVPKGSAYVLLSGRQEITPAPYALYALDGGGSGAVWTESGSDIYFDTGNVGVGDLPSSSYQFRAVADSGEFALYAYAGSTSAGDAITGESDKDGGRAVVGQSNAAGGYSYGVYGYAESPQGAGVLGYNGVSTGNAIGVYGRTGSTTGFGGYFVGRGYFANNVGIGTNDPQYLLDVQGTANMLRLKLANWTSGYVLGCDPNGFAVWQPPGAGSSLWSTSGSDIYYDNGDVGIGTSTPTTSLDVVNAASHAIRGVCSGENTEGFVGSEYAGIQGTGPVGVLGQTSTTYGQALMGEAYAAIGTTYGVYGMSHSSSGRGVYGNANAESGDTVGVLGETGSNTGYGVHGHNASTSTSGRAIGVYGTSDAYYGVGVKGEVSTDRGYGLWGRSAGTLGRGVVAEATSETGNTAGLDAYAVSPTGYGVFAFNEAETGDAVAVYGETASADGFAGYFLGNGYYSGNVGIGILPQYSTSQLTVEGRIESNTGGFKFPDGTLQTTAAANWEQNGTDIYYNAGEVGIGLSNPYTKLHVSGGNWNVSSTQGDFKIGSYSYGLKIGVDVDGAGAGDSYVCTQGEGSRLFLGSEELSAMTISYPYVGIGTSYPSEKLDVNGKIKASSIQLTTSPTNGYVLTCDASGNASWQEPTGSGTSFELPYSGTSSVDDAAFEVINNGTGISSCAISAKLTSPSSHSDATAGYFSAVGSNGMALYATNDGGYSVRSRNSGSGTAFYGSSSSGNGAYVTSGGSGTYGIRGHASNGRGVYASGNGTGTARTALFAENTNSAGIAFMATVDSSDATSVIVNQGTGDIIRGFSGTSGGDLVFRVQNDGTTAVSVLEITGGSDLAEPFDVSEPQAEPGMVVEIDPDNPGKLRIARGAYNRRVAGVISGANGVAVGMQLADLPGSENSMPIALSGRVWVHCDATTTGVQAGDLLTTAERPGHAMPVTDYNRAHGCVIGKAMSELAPGETGMVLVLVNLQ